MTMANFKMNGLHQYERHDEKVTLVLDWLGEHRYATAAILASLLGIGVNATRRFLNRLQQKGWLHCATVSSQRAPVWLLTTLGKSTISAMLGKHYLWPTEISKVSFHSLRHDLIAQEYLLQHRNQYARYLTERRLKQERKLVEPGMQQKIPDLVLVTSHERQAIEIELTAKSQDRIYCAYVEYVTALKEGRYDKVIYVFDKPALLDKYKALFNRQQWPTFRYHGKHRKLLPQVDSRGRRIVFEPHRHHDVAQRFCFRQRI